MKTTVGALKTALTKVQKAVHTSYVTLKGTGTTLAIHASNGPQGCAKATVAVSDGGDFVAQVDGNRLAAVLGGADASQECVIQATKTTVRFKFGKADIRFQVADEEPTLLEESRWVGAVSIGEKVSGADLKNAFERVSPFAARNDVRYYLNGVLMTVRGGRLTLVATDGFRLARLTTSVAVSEVPDSIIPISIADALATVLDSSSEVQIVTVGELESRGVGFRAENFEVMCPVIAGQFPNFEKVMPNVETMTRATVNRKAALAVLERIAAVAEGSGGSRYVRVVIKERKFEVLTLDEQSHDQADLETEVPFAKPMEMGFQPKLLIPALAAVKTDNVAFLYTKAGNDRNQKVLIRDAEGEEWGVIVMPSKT